MSVFLFGQNVKVSNEIDAMKPPIVFSSVSGLFQRSKTRSGMDQAPLKLISGWSQRSTAIFWELGAIS